MLESRGASFSDYGGLVFHHQTEERELGLSGQRYKTPLASVPGIICILKFKDIFPFIHRDDYEK